MIATAQQNGHSPTAYLDMYQRRTNTFAGSSRKLGHFPVVFRGISQTWRLV